MKDNLGSTRAVVDDAGDVVEAYDYYPFGLQSRSYKEKGDPLTKETFTGKEEDIESKLHYFGARYYDAGAGRWLSVDPMMSQLLSFSPYNYCINSPIQFLDPDGERIATGQELKTIAKFVNAAMERYDSWHAKAVMAYNDPNVSASEQRQMRWNMRHFDDDPINTSEIKRVEDMSDDEKSDIFWHRFTGLFLTDNTLHGYSKELGGAKIEWNAHEAGMSKINYIEIDSGPEPGELLSTNWVYQIRFYNATRPGSTRGRKIIGIATWKFETVEEYNEFIISRNEKHQSDRSTDSSGNNSTHTPMRVKVGLLDNLISD